jgi:uncharacterized protein (DUF427 family)
MTTRAAKDPGHRYQRSTRFRSSSFEVAVAEVLWWDWSMKTRGHAIEVTPGSDQVVVRVMDVVVATSSRSLVLTETGYPTRYYLPSADVQMDLLRSSTTTSHCPFKGDAVYWSVQTGDGMAKDVVWSYPEPFPRVEEVAGLLAFWAEKPGVALEVNGQAT